MATTIEQTTMRKVYLRILPLAMIVYFFCYLDRINVSFAALQMNASIGLTAAAYGLSSTAFYLGYCIFEVPSNVDPRQGRRAHLDRAHHDHLGPRIGCHGVRHRTDQLPGRPLPARRCRSRLVPRHRAAVHLLVPRPSSRAHRLQLHACALPISVAFGAPISTAILGMDGFLGFAGWKWIYIMEAIPTVLIGVFVLFPMTDKPAKARWLSAEEKNWLITTLEHERRAVEVGGQVQHVAGTGEPKDPAAVAQLSRHRHRQPGPAAVRATDHQVARRDQYGYRLCDDAGLHLRRDQHDGLGLDFRPHG